MAEFNPRRRKKPIREKLLQPFADFMQIEASSGVLLMSAAFAAILWANSSWSAGYFSLWQTNLSIGIGSSGISKPALPWINDGLMAVFFFLVGLEIKREILLGELSTFRKAALPIAAAIGGMLVPALIFVAFNIGGAEVRGWGVPMATDIAFALGVLALAGSKVPSSLKVFLAALAIVDDLGAVLVIALFYAKGLDFTMLAGGFAVFAVLLALNRFAVRTPIPYLLLGVVMWVFFLKSGVHATIAGVLLALTIPARVHLNPKEFLTTGKEILDEFEACDPGEEGDYVLLSEQRQIAVQELEKACEQVQMPLERIENSLHPYVTFGIVPLFALANAGVALDAGAASAFSSPVAFGTFFGLVIGKPIGIALLSWIALKSKLAEKPEGVSTRHIVGTGVLAGIGFTMSLFIAELAFVDQKNLEIAKVSILAASIVAGTLGFLILRGAKPPKPAIST